MENDMLSLMTMGEETKSFVRKIFRLALAILILAGMYAMLNAYEWYRVINKSRLVLTHFPRYWYTFFFRPAVIFLAIIISLIGHVLNYNAYRAINRAMENNDYTLFNKGLKNIYRVFILTVISFSTILIVLVYEHLLK